MCGTCGCNQSEIKTEIISIEADLMTENTEYANDNRKYFFNKKLTTINLVASPGAGKTTLLEATAKTLGNKNSFAVIVGDQATENDANRLKNYGINALQIFTNKVCHLDAHMIAHALEEIVIADDSFLFIENVGNLICPALFDLGERYRIVLLSITEGEDKPLKYPYMFGSADLVIITKIDLLPYLSFDLKKCIDHIKTVNPRTPILQLSATSLEGFSSWLNWLENNKIMQHATT